MKDDMKGPGYPLKVLGFWILCGATAFAFAYVVVVLLFGAMLLLSMP